MADEVVNVIFQFGSPHFEFVNFLIRREVNFFLDAVYGVVEPVVLIEDFPEVIVGAFEAANGFAMFRKLAQDRMMQVHGTNSLSWVVIPPRGIGSYESAN